MSKFKVKVKSADKQVEIESEFEEKEYIIRQVNYFMEHGKFDIGLMPGLKK